MDVKQFGLRVARSRTRVPDIAEVPGGRLVDLPGRGRTYVVDVPGPEGAPTLVLLHALACTCYLTWFPALTGLSQRYRLILFDQRWHGRGIRSESFRLEDCADDVIAVADAVGADQVICAGYSMGGLVAQLAARRHPDRVSGLVLCATTYQFQEKLRERIFHVSFAAMADALRTVSFRRAEQAAQKLPEVPDLTCNGGQVDLWAFSEFRSTSGWALAQAVAEIGTFNSASWLPSLRVPTAVVVTTRDRAIPIYRQLAMVELIPDASTHLVNAGHVACVLEADRFVPVLLDACASVATRATTSPP